MATEHAAAAPAVPSAVDGYSLAGRKRMSKETPVRTTVYCSTLTGSHPALQSGKTSISYQLSTNCSGPQNQVSGKCKLGGFSQNLDLCVRFIAQMSEGEEYNVSSYARGRLMEVNGNILHRPSHPQEEPSTEGYIAVGVTEGLLTQKQYEEVVIKYISDTTAVSET